MTRLWRHSIFSRCSESQSNPHPSFPSCVYRIPVWVCSWRSEVSASCLPPSLSLFFWDKFSYWTWSSSVQLDWITKQIQRSCFCLPSAGNICACLWAWLLCCRHWTQVLCLPSKPFPQPLSPAYYPFCSFLRAGPKEKEQNRKTKKAKNMEKESMVSACGLSECCACVMCPSLNVERLVFSYFTSRMWCFGKMI